MKRYKLESVCTYITDGSHYSPKSVDEGLPLASVKDMTNYGIEISTCRRISKSDFNELIKNNCQPQIGDVLIAKDGSYLKHAFVVEEEPQYVTLSSIGIFRVNNDIIEPYYLKYLFLNDKFKDYVTNGFVSGTALKRIVLKAFKGIEINVPDKSTQLEIINIIKPIDDKISHNNHLISDLEEYSQLLFHKWFIDFNFPDENENPYKNSGGEMEKVEGKMIPKGWYFTHLNDVIDNIIDHRGKTPTKLNSKWSSEGIIALSALNVKNGRLTNLSKSNKVSYELYAKWMKDELTEGDILMTSEAPLGEFYLVLNDEKYCLSQRLFAIRSNSEIVNFSYLYQELSGSRGLKKIQNKKSGSTVFGIRQEELRKINILLPDKNIQDNYDRIVMPLLRKIRALDTENQLLEETRDLLIKKLIK